MNCLHRAHKPEWECGNTVKAITIRVGCLAALILAVMYYRNNQCSLLSSFLLEAKYTEGLSSSLLCVLMLQHSFQTQCFKCIYAVRTNILYKNTMPVVCLDVSSRTENKKGTRTNYQQAYCWFGFERSHSQYVLMVKVRMLFSTMFGGTWRRSKRKSCLFSVQDGSYFWNRPLLNPSGVRDNSWMLTWSVHYRTLIAWRTYSVCQCMRACVDMCYFATIIHRTETKFIGFYTVW